MTNDRVIQLTKMGLDDDIIIAKIKTGHTKFALGDEDLVALKKAGVSGKVVAAMLESNVLTEARVKVDGNTVELHTLGEAKTGGRLGSKLTAGIKSVKEKAYLQGQHAAVISSTKPKIEVELPPNDTIDNYILVRMNGKGDRRELEVGSVGTAVGAKQGVRAEDVVKTSAEPLGGRRYMITTQNPLRGREYILYVVGSADFTKGILRQGLRLHGGMSRLYDGVNHVANSGVDGNRCGLLLCGVVGAFNCAVTPSACGATSLDSNRQDS